MRILSLLVLLSVFSVFQSCRSSKSTGEKKNDKPGKVVAARHINTRQVPADSVVRFAETLIGVPYKYGSANIEDGFDCSGFITYVFNRFQISVPRSSVDFTNAGKAVPLKEAKRGDLILFTGTDRSTRTVGHMGIITQNRNGKPLFIHSASGNKRGVMISDLNSYFAPRLVKVIRVFDQPVK